MHMFSSLFSDCGSEEAVEKPYSVSDDAAGSAVSQTVRKLCV